jgi:amino acid adenylation domain-containing protein
MTETIEADKILVFPLSFAQQRLWLLDQLSPGSSVYNIPMVLRLAGQLDTSMLRASLNEIVQRHEILRTTFHIVDGQPAQVVAATADLPFITIDLRVLPLAERAHAHQQLIWTQARQPFDLARSPLLRATLLHLDQTEHILLLTMHHIIFDAWSIEVLTRELRRSYAALVAGLPPSLPELPIQYADFALWQREWLQGPVLETQLTYWRNQLADLPTLNLPTDYPRPPFQRFQGARCVRPLSSVLAGQLSALSQAHGCTLFMSTLAAFAVLLARYASQTDVVIGSPIANRTHHQTTDLIGFFVNTLVLRIDLAGRPTFRELLGRVRETTLNAYTHQDLPFEKLVEVLQPERDLSRMPLFQVMLAFQSGGPPVFEVAGVNLQPMEAELGVAKFDLTLTLKEREEELSAVIEYNTDLFEEPTIRRMLGHFETLLHGIIADPNQPITTLPLLTPEERRRVLVDWNGTPADYPKDLCIQQLFEAQVDRTPDAVAVVLEHQHFTFRSLNGLSNQLARYLRKLGVGPEVIIGICMDRSVDMIVGLMGVLKAGGAYVPLDPAYPPDRLMFMLANAQVHVLLTQQRLVATLPAHAVRIVRIDSDWAAIAQESVEDLDVKTIVSNLAYIIYTSGSTGRPKGVLVSHEGVGNLVAEQMRTFGIGPGSRLLQFVSFSFDGAVGEIFTALLSGATLCLAPQNASLLGPALIHMLREQAITAMKLPPSVLSVLLPDELPSLCTVIAAGEACSPQLITQWGAHRRFINAYGPSEATVCVSAAVLTPHNQRPHIGNPFHNKQIYLLDAQLELVPVGVLGEIHLGGVGLARGYSNQPDLTAECFIPHPFSEEGRQRLYKTGDLARYLANGTIEFVGRIDHQVKVRGFRIELGEIEAVLKEHSSVLNGVVLVREDVPGDRRLVAYVIPLQYKTLTASDLRRFLQLKLPEYMLPSAFIMLDELPLTANGKLDRTRLSAVDTARPGLENTFVAPTNPVEEVVAGIWADVLGIKEVGIQDNFFALGGHSLLAAQVIKQICDTFHIEFFMRQLFERPTVAGLAAVLVEDAQRRARIERIAELLIELDQLPDEEIDKMLERRGLGLISYKS